MILEKHLPLARPATYDSEALREWVHAHHDDIFRFLNHLTRHREAAEDLAQQTFVNAYQALDSFRGESGMRTWLHRIAFREYVAWRRKRRLTLPLDVLGGRHDRRIADVENEVALLGALHKIPAAHREAFLLFEVQQLSVDEVADVMALKPGTVKSHLHFARKNLRTLIGDEAQEANHEAE
ncbi:MAG: RNA polymerase sigma factor [Armatimonadetes bacterium]|nr:RNA polymerase sigma factor [Armatimonadota bacterium]